MLYPKPKKRRNSRELSGAYVRRLKTLTITKKANSSLRRYSDPLRGEPTAPIAHNEPLASDARSLAFTRQADGDYVGVQADEIGYRVDIPLPIALPIKCRKRERNPESGDLFRL